MPAPGEFRGSARGCRRSSACRCRRSSPRAIRRRVARPRSRRSVSAPQSALSLLETPSFFIVSSSEMPCTKMRFRSSDLAGVRIDQLGDEGDRPHLAHQRGVEADLVDAVEDLRSPCCGSSGALDRIDVDDQHVRRVAAIDQREDRRIAHVAAVPIGLAVDLDGLEQERQAGRGHDRVDRQLVVGEHLDLAGAHIGGADVELQRTARHADRVEVDRLLQHARAAD